MNGVVPFRIFHMTYIILNTKDNLATATRDKNLRCQLAKYNEGLGFSLTMKYPWKSPFTKVFV